MDFKLIRLLHHKMSGRVKYRLGGKAPSLDCDSNDIKSIDCSGHSRYLLARGSGQELIIPDGSQNQLAWAKKNLKRLSYKDVGKYCAKDRSRWFIAFLKPKKGKAWPRHVWLLNSDGLRVVTLESHGSGGVNSRRWDNRALVGCVDCFELESA